MEFNLIKINGIILKLNMKSINPYFTILDRENGKLDIYAFGTQHEKSRRKQTLSISNEISALCNKTSDYLSLKEAVIINSFENISKDLQKLSFMFLLLEIIDKLCAYNHKFEKYDLILETLKKINNEEDYIKYVLFTIFHIFKYEGIINSESYNDKENIKKFIIFIENNNDIEKVNAIKVKDQTVKDILFEVKSIISKIYNKDLNSFNLFRL